MRFSGRRARCQNQRTRRRPPCAPSAHHSPPAFSPRSLSPLRRPWPRRRPAPRPTTAPPTAKARTRRGRYRNLFVEAGRTPKEVDAKIEAAYRQLFHGDPETELLFFPAGSNENGPLAYIPDIQHTDVRSEGMSYGMMITVQLDEKAEFDALWNWSMTHMYHADPKHPTYGFFSWQLNYDGSVMDELPAPDGEEYYAMALLFAANRWGNGKGIYDYQAQAHRLLDHMVHREPIKGPVRQRARRREHTVGKEVNDENTMILFSPDERNTFTDASYHLPAFYELWARWGPERDRAFWAKAASVSRDFFVKSADPKTGLVPNLGAFDGTPLGWRGPGSAAFREDAWRVAMNWSVDWSWWAKDPRQQELSDRLQAFFESQGLETYGDNWQLDGKLLRDRHSPGLVADERRRLARRHRQGPRAEVRGCAMEPRGPEEQGLPLLRRPPLHDEPHARGGAVPGDRAGNEEPTALT